MVIINECKNSLWQDVSIVINYGNTAGTFLSRRMILRGPIEKETIFSYYNQDPEAQVMFLEGFAEKSDSYKQLKDFSTWDGTEGKGLFTGLHKVTVPVSPTKDEKVHLQIDSVLYGHFVEIIPGQDEVAHYVGVRSCLDVNKTDVTVRIPITDESNVSKIKLRLESGVDITFDQEVSGEGQFDFGEIHGHGWVKPVGDELEIYWHVPKSQVAGEHCKVFWYTKPNG